MKTEDIVTGKLRGRGDQGTREFRAKAPIWEPCTIVHYRLREFYPICHTVRGILVTDEF